MSEKKKGKKKGVALQGEEDEKLTKLQKKVLHWLRDCPVQSLKSGLRIRIHFIQIRIQHFRMSTNPDRDPIWI
jgi:hypothetical protein